MLALHGTGVSNGIAIGKAYVLYRERPEVPEYVLPRGLVDEEVERFRAAIDLARTQLERIRNHIPKSAPPEIASIIDTHMLILHDKMIAESPVGTIFKQQCNAEWALKLQADRLAEVFEQMEDPYLRNKKADVNQVVDRVLRNLLNSHDEEHEQISDALEGQIVVANDLSPADTVLLKHNKVAAFITNLGGPISHTAILARNLEIPAIVAVHNATRYVRNGEDLIVDGKLGVLLVAPDKKVVAEYRQRQKDIVQTRRLLDAMKASRSITRDGVEIALFANIELPDDIKAVGKVGAAGVGLYRTEFLFMNRPDMPDEEEQFRAYVKVVKALGDKPVTIRTLDLGADKRVDGGRDSPNPGANPALGLRAVRLCLSDISLFRPQLRAILRASAHGRVRLMIPMISNLDEVFRVLDLIGEIKLELKREGQKFDSNIPIGGMIEVPAAAVAADLFAPHLDFLSIGTNDLIQYTLAIDRIDDAVNYLYDPLHPSVLRLIATTIKAGRAAGIPVAMCGEMAGDPRYTRILLGMGLNEFSMHPSGLLEIKKIVRESDLSELEAFAARVLAARSTDELHGLVEKMNAAYESLPRNVEPAS
jgi:phosphoenolpyruvate-protein phosphotransferase (PTS system enzyme I)